MAADYAPSSAARFCVSRLVLTDFRCYGELRLDLDERPVVLSGPNGAGKTNLLEAVSMLVPGRGLRSARVAEMARQLPTEAEEQANRAWAVAATVRTPAGPVDLGTGRDAGAAAEGRERRLVRIDGTSAKNQAALAEHLSAVWLTPRMDRLFADGASARRRFVDRLVFGVDPAHAGRVTAYDTAMRERSRLLRGGPGANNADPAWLSALENTMAERGIAIAAARKEMVAHLGAFCERPVGPFPGVRIALDGAVEQWLDEGPALAA
ncbi:MAG: AAA family ATPase, partial [Rhodospirillales bacterium]|nr:AAA family ATPase [Rhodospirillales bacterium]